MKKIAWYSLAALLAGAVFCLSSRYNYLLFHSLVELFSVIVAAGIFIVAWHTRRLAASAYILFLGCAYLCIGVLDLAHTLSYKGMGVFPAATANLPTQLWIQARYIEAFSLLLAPLLVRRRLNVSLPLFCYVSATLCLLGITFATDLFPICYVEGEGLTPFKKASEYAICVVLLSAAVLHYLRRKDLDTGFLMLMLGSIVLTAMAELAFTRYFSVYGPANVAGHLLKVGSLALIYRAVVVAGLAKPQTQLREMEAKYRSVVENANEAILVTQGNSVKYCNLQVSDLTGYSPEEIGARNFIEFIHPEDREKVASEYQERLSGRETSGRYSIRIVTKNRREKWVIANSALLDWEDLPASLVMLTDVTEQKRAEDDLRRSESKFRRLSDSNVVGIMFWNTAGDITEANDEFLRMVGYTREDVISGNVRWKDITPPEYAAADEEALEELAATGFTKNLEKEYVRKDGSRISVLLGAAMLEGSGDTGICYVQDLSELKKVEEDLKKSEERFRSLMEQSPLAIEILSPEGQIREVNTAWMQLWGFNGDEKTPVLQSYNMLTDEQIAGQGIAPLVERAFAGEAVALPAFQYSADRAMEEMGLGRGEYRSPWIQCHLYPVKSTDGKVTFVVNTYTEVTELKRAEEDLHAYQERLRALASELTLTEERERRRISTDLHDGAAQSLAFARIQLTSVKKIVADAGACRKLDEMSQLLKESLQQIRDVLLDLSSPALNEIGLAAALSEWLEEQVGRRHGLRVSFDDRAGIVPLTDDMRAVLFRNARELLMNVVKHAEADKVSVVMESSGETLQVTVRDDGIGFDPEAQESKPTNEGAFGLFSVRERMADMGGSIEIESAPGEGCKVTLIVPVGVS